jgi:hypothetical protein
VNQFGAGEIAVRLNKATEWKLSAADPLQLKTKVTSGKSLAIQQSSTVVLTQIRPVNLISLPQSPFL